MRRRRRRADRRLRSARRGAGGGERWTGPERSVSGTCTHRRLHAAHRTPTLRVDLTTRLVPAGSFTLAVRRSLTAPWRDRTPRRARGRASFTVFFLFART